MFGTRALALVAVLTVGTVGFARGVAVIAHRGARCEGRVKNVAHPLRAMASTASGGTAFPKRSVRTTRP